MLESHAPETRIRSLRAFAVHLLTVTLGLLLALGLESIVEWRHHVHLEREADAHLQRELRDNDRWLGRTLAAIPAARNGAQDTVDVFVAWRDGHPTSFDLTHVGGITLNQLFDGRWQMARQNNAVNYMDDDRAAAYSEAYTLQTTFLQEQAQTLTAYVQLGAFFPKAPEAFQRLSPAEMDQVRVAAQLLVAHLSVLEHIGTSLQSSYAHALAPAPAQAARPVARSSAKHPCGENGWLPRRLCHLRRT